MVSYYCREALVGLLYWEALYSQYWKALWVYSIGRTCGYTVLAGLVTE